MPKVRDLNRKRDDYFADDWKRNEALYEGGRKISDLKEVILPRRPAETDDWYALRLASFHYLNRTAKVIDEFAGSIFADDLLVLAARPSRSAERPALDQAYIDFVADPTGANTGTLGSLLYDGWIQAQIRREHFFAPHFAGGELPEGASRADQERVGGLTPRLREIPADAILNLHRDEHGLAWAMVRYRIESTEPLASGEPKSLFLWLLVDRQQVRTFELQVERSVREPDGDLDATEVAAKGHRWANARNGLGICPIVTLCAANTAWLIDRIALHAIAETRKRNALFWYEDLCCYPVPVHTGQSGLKEVGEERDGANRKRGAQYWLEGDQGDVFEYMEPAGQSLEHLAKRIDSFGHELSEVVHQAASALGPEAAAQVQSAASKVRDSIAKRLLAASFAEDVRACAREILDLVAFGRGEDVQFEVAGLSAHDIEDAGLVADEAGKVQSLTIPSPTFHREYAKKVARGVLTGVVPLEKLEQMDAELDAADESAFALPTAAEPGAVLEEGAEK